MGNITFDHRHIESNPGSIEPSNNSNRLNQAHALADRLRDTNPKAVWFYYKVVNTLDPNTIDRLVVATREKRSLSNPCAYFNKCATNEMMKMGAV